MKYGEKPIQHQKIFAQHPKEQHSIFVSIDTECFCLMFVYISEFFPTDSLGGTFINQGYFEIVQINIFPMDYRGM